MPTSSSLVTNLPADFNTFGQGVDTSLQYLLGGTTGQVLSKTSGTNMAFTWVTPTDQTPLTTKGDLFTFSTVDARLGVGTNGQTLVADSTASTGLKWATPATAASGMTFIQRSAFSNVANTSTTFDGIFTSTYASYLVMIEQWYAATGADDIYMQLRVSGVTRTTTYDGTTLVTAPASSPAIATVVNAASNTWILGDQSGTTSQPTRGYVYLPMMGASGSAMYSGQLSNTDSSRYYTTNGSNYNAQVYTGLIFSSSSSNITGTISVYGLAKS